MTVYGPYPGVVRDWHDGDTCHVDVDLGFSQIEAAYDLDGHPRLSARLYGCNAPELSTDSGKASLAAVKTICPPGTRVVVTSHGWDKYGGRFDAEIRLASSGDSVADLLIASGYAIAVAT